MKKNLLLIFCTLLIVCILSCNGDEKEQDGKKTVSTTAKISTYNFDWIDKRSDNICESHGGAGNFIIGSTLSDSMINHFDSIYRMQDDHQTKVRAFDSSYWIDACTVSAIAKFLKTSTKHDGIRIYFGCSLKPDLSYNSDQYKQKTTLFIFPTQPQTSTNSDMSEHGDDLIQIPTSGCAIKSNYLKPPGNANSEIEAFNKTYRKSTTLARLQKDSLSQAIWIDSCVIYFIDNLLKSNNGIVDGINIRTAAYFENFNKPVKGRWKKNQSTIIIVPSSLDHGRHIDNWDIIDALIAQKKRRLSGALNHGELCPQVCN